jgi:phospholipid-binding lipoprotein MlaA
VADGAYVVLPLAGPSTVRDTAGLAVDWFIDPVGWLLTTPESIAQASSDAISTRDDEDAIIDQFYYKSLEPYSATRAAYLQHEAFQ